MKVGLLGDTHGNHRWIKRATRRFRDLDITTVIQVGDLGVSRRYDQVRDWNYTNDRLERYGVTLLVAPGNHEDYDLIESMKPRENGWLPLRSNVLLAPRGLRTELGGRTFVWLGGAGSVDRTLRQRWNASSPVQKFWWEQEALTHEDVERTVAGGTADVMVSHDAPYGVPEIDTRLLDTARLWNANDLAYANECRETFTRAVEGVRPRLLLHGHYHFGVRGVWQHPDGEGQTRVFGLGADGDLGEGLGVLDTETLRAEHLPLDAPG